MIIVTAICVTVAVLSPACELSEGSLLDVLSHLPAYIKVPVVSPHSSGRLASRSLLTCAA